MAVSFNLDFRMAFGRELISLGADCLKLSHQLIDEGHKLIRLSQELHQKLCSPEEFEQSLDIAMEVAKEKISSCLVRVVETDVSSDNYVSPLLEKLRHQRNLAGYSRKWLVDTGGDESWRYEVNPAKKLFGQMFRHSELFGAELSEFRKLEKLAVEFEKARIFSLVGAQKLAFLTSPDVKFLAGLQDLIDTEVHQIGFHRSKKLSKPPNLLQYSRPLTDAIHLRLVLIISASTFEARLFLSEKCLGRKFDGNWNEWYSANSAHEIRIWDILPWFKYRFCSDAISLLVNFYAHLDALKITIERVHQSALNASILHDG